MTEALYLIETSMFIDDVAGYGKTIPGLISPDDNLIVSLSTETSVETLANIGCDYLSTGGELKLLYVIPVPARSPFEYGITQKGEGTGP